LNAIKALWSDNRRFQREKGRLRLEKISVVACCGKNYFRESPPAVLFPGASSDLQVDSVEVKHARFSTSDWVSLREEVNCRQSLTLESVRVWGAGHNRQEPLTQPSTKTGAKPVEPFFNSELVGRY